MLDVAAMHLTAKGEQLEVDEMEVKLSRVMNNSAIILPPLVCKGKQAAFTSWQQAVAMQQAVRHKLLPPTCSKL